MFFEKEYVYLEKDNFNSYSDTFSTLTFKLLSTASIIQFISSPFPKFKAFITSLGILVLNDFEFGFTGDTFVFDSIVIMPPNMFNNV